METDKMNDNGIKSWISNAIMAVVCVAVVIVIAIPIFSGLW